MSDPQARIHIVGVGGDGLAGLTGRARAVLTSAEVVYGAEAVLQLLPELTAERRPLGNDLARLGKLLDELPNVQTEIGAVLAEIGRQPRFARDWFVRYQDRVLFGKDSFVPEEFPYYFRVLETADDYFPYYRRRHAFWKIYGLDLPDVVLRKLYYGNALRVVPGLDRGRFPG